MISYDQQNDQPCGLCHKPPDNNMANCSNCNNSFHTTCVRIPMDKNFQCQDCGGNQSFSTNCYTNQIQEQPHHALPTKVKLQLQRLEEERDLKQKQLAAETALNQQYIKMKYQLLEEQINTTSSVHSQKSISISEELEDIAHISLAT